MVPFKRSRAGLRSHPPFGRCVVACLAGIFALTMYGAVEASIVRPEAPSFDFELSDGTASSGNAGYSTTASNEHVAQDSARQIEFKPRSAQQGPIGGNSSTSGPSSTAGAGVSLAIACRSTSILAAPALAGWVSVEQQALLPAQIANELLRPPQV